MNEALECLRAVVEQAARDATSESLASFTDSARRDHERDGFMPSPQEALGSLYFMLGSHHPVSNRVRNMRVRRERLSGQVGAYAADAERRVNDAYTRQEVA